MPRVVDLKCSDCGVMQENAWIERDEYGSCKECAGAMRWVPGNFHTDVFGSPKFYRGLDMEFSSSRDALRYARQNGMEQAPSADKHHGARNEESHIGLGKKTFFFPKRGGDAR